MTNHGVMVTVISNAVQLKTVFSNVSNYQPRPFTACHKIPLISPGLTHLLKKFKEAYNRGLIAGGICPGVYNGEAYSRRAYNRGLISGGHMPGGL